MFLIYTPKAGNKEIVDKLKSLCVEIFVFDTGNIKLLEQNNEVREKYYNRFQHILVDEFQDTNQAQYNLIKALSSPELTRLAYHLGLSDKVEILKDKIE